MDDVPAAGVGDLHALAGGAHGLRLLHQSQEHGGTLVKKGPFPGKGHGDLRADQLLVVVIQQSPIVLRRVRVVEDPRVVHRDPGHFRPAAADGPLETALPGIGQDPGQKRRRDQKGMSGLAHADRAGKLRLGEQKGRDGHGRKERDVHRSEENAVTLVLQVGEADLGGVEHLGAGIVLVSEEYDAVVGEMPLQLLGVVARDHHDAGDPRLAEGGHDPLGNGDGTDIQHGLEVPHPGGHARRHDHSADAHTANLLSANNKKIYFDDLKYTPFI